MKLYFMKKEALDILKSNLDVVYNMYFTQLNNDWLWNICGGNPFVEFKEIQDFQLAPIDPELSKGEIEFANCKILYEHLSFLTESQACDERLWAGLCHSVFYNYLRNRWGYDSKTPKNQKEAVSNIKSRFFFSGGVRSGLYRNSLSKYWWVGRNTYDSSKSNPFEKLDIIGSNDISSKINDIFYSNNFSANPVILNGIVKAIKNFRDENMQITLKEHIRPSLQYLNAVGGGIILDCLDEDEIANILIDNIYGIIQGDQQGVETNDDDFESIDVEDDDETLNNDIDENDNHDEYVVIGEHVNVCVKETNEQKTIVVDYLHNSTKIPTLAKMLLGCYVGDEVVFNGKTYVLEEIIK